MLQRMGGLETIHANRCPRNEQYEHVHDYLKATNSARAVGTLSKSEWEATSKYYEDLKSFP